LAAHFAADEFSLITKTGYLAIEAILFFLFVVQVVVASFHRAHEDK